MGLSAEYNKGLLNNVDRDDWMIEHSDYYPVDKRYPNFSRCLC